MTKVDAAYYAKLVSQLHDPNSSEHALHVLASDGRRTLDFPDSNLMQAVAAAGLQNVLDGVFHALDLDDTEISAPSATEIFKAFRGNTLVAAYFKSPFKGPRAKETLAWHLGQTAPELANHVV